MPLPRFFIDPDFLIELVYSMTIMISCLIIYFKTSEIYKLTSHRGIKYFRITFLFFAVTYFLRFFTKILVLGLVVSGARVRLGEFSDLTSFLLLYTGFMTIFYLLYGLSKKKLGKFLPDTTDIFHVISVLLSSIIIFFQVPMIFIIMTLSLLFYLMFVGYSNYRESRKKRALPQFYVVYFLLILFSMLNILDILISDFFRTIKLLIYIFSISLFLIILHRVLKVLSVESNGKQKKQIRDNI